MMSVVRVEVSEVSLILIAYDCLSKLLWGCLSSDFRNLSIVLNIGLLNRAEGLGSRKYNWLQWLPSPTNRQVEHIPQEV